MEWSMTTEQTRPMTIEQIREELKSLLKDYHYRSDEQHISKDVVTALENIIGALKWLNYLYSVLF